MTVNDLITLLDGFDRDLPVVLVTDLAGVEAAQIDRVEDAYYIAKSHTDGFLEVVPMGEQTTPVVAIWRR